MAEWYRVIKTIRGNQYVYMQRTRRVSGRKSPVTESYSLGRLDGGGRKRSGVSEGLSGVAMAIFGVEDEYGQRVDSLWNRLVNEEKPSPTTDIVSNATIPTTMLPSDAQALGSTGNNACPKLDSIDAENS